jgi:AcrR family transcriptional regulator
MGVPGAAVRRRSDGEETRRRVLDAVVETIVDVGYYKASSNVIARRARVEGATLEERLECVLDLMADRFETSRLLVEIQILMDLSSNPRVPEETRRAMRRRNAEQLAKSVRPLFAQALGDGISDDLVLYAFTVVNGYFTSRVLLGLTAELPSDEEMRRHLVHGLAASIGGASP